VAEVREALAEVLQEAVASEADLAEADSLVAVPVEIGSI
jgi:hypothetical protein